MSRVDANRDGSSDWEIEAAEYGRGVAGVETEVGQRREGDDSGRIAPVAEIEIPHDGERSQRRTAIHTVQECIDVPSPRAAVERNLSEAREGAQAAWGRGDEGDLLNVWELRRDGIRARDRGTALDNQLGYVHCGPSKGVQEESGGLYDLKEYDPVPLGRNEGEEVCQNLTWGLMRWTASGLVYIPYMHA